MLKPTVEEVNDWLVSPVTKLYFSKLLEQAAIRRQEAGEGRFLSYDAIHTGAAYEKAMTIAEVYEAAASPTVEDLLEEDNDE
jgi:hypothetical protein